MKKWEEEFEDRIGSYNNGIQLIDNKRTNFDELLKKYIGLERGQFGEKKVNIKVRKGTILIERI